MIRQLAGVVLALPILLTAPALPARAGIEHVRANIEFRVDGVVLSPCAGPSSRGEDLTLRGTIVARITVTMKDDAVTDVAVFLDPSRASGSGQLTGAAYALHPGPTTKLVTNAVPPAVVHADVALHVSIRPDEIGTPWELSPPGFFTSGGHESRLRIFIDASGVSRALEMSGTPSRTCGGERRD